MSKETYLLIQKQTDVFIKCCVAFVWMSIGSWHAQHLQLWYFLKVTGLTAHPYARHIHICMTSIQPYQKAVSCSRQADNSQKWCAGWWTVAPTPPDSTDLYQSALLNTPWAMKLENICVELYACVHVWVGGWGGLPMWELVTLHAHLHALPDEWRTEVIHSDDGQWQIYWTLEVTVEVADFKATPCPTETLRKNKNTTQTPRKLDKLDKWQKAMNMSVRLNKVRHRCVFACVKRIASVFLYVLAGRQMKETQAEQHIIFSLWGSCCKDNSLNKFWMLHLIHCHGYIHTFSTIGNNIKYNLTLTHMQHNPQMHVHVKT